MYEDNGIQGRGAGQWGMDRGAGESCCPLTRSPHKGRWHPTTRGLGPNTHY